MVQGVCCRSSPEIQEALVDHLAGSADLARIQRLAHTSRRDVADAITGFQGTVGGGALDRLCELALNLGLVHDWVHDAHSRDAVRRRSAFARLAFVSVYEPCRRVTGDLLFQALDDSDPEVWLWACRSAIVSGTGQQIEAVFEVAVTGEPAVPHPPDRGFTPSRGPVVRARGPGSVAVVRFKAGSWRARHSGGMGASHRHR